MKIDLVRSIEQLRPFREAWSALPSTNPFGTFDFAEDCLRLCPAQTPFVIVLSDPDGLLAVAPWAIERGRLRRLTGIWGEDAWFHDPIIRPAGEKQAAVGLVRALLDHRKEWDSLHLNLRAEPEHPLLGELKRLGMVLERQIGWRQHRIMDFSDGWEAYWNGRSPSFRKKLRSLQRKLAEVPHRFLDVDAENLESLLDAIFRLHHARLGALRDWAPTYALFRGMALRAFESGTLTLSALEIKDQTAAVIMQIRYGDTGYGILTAFDPAFADLSVGTLLMMRSLERACRAGCRRIDPGGGDDEYKVRLHSAIQRTVLLDAASPASVRGRAALFWQRETQWRLEERIKPWLRAHSRWLGGSSRPERDVLLLPQR